MEMMTKFKDIFYKISPAVALVFLSTMLLISPAWATEVPDEEMHFTGKHIHFSNDRWGDDGSDFLNDRQTENSNVVTNTGRVWNNGGVGVTLGEYTVGGASAYVVTPNGPSLVEVSGSTMTTTIQLPEIVADMHGLTKTFRRKSGVTTTMQHRQVNIIPYAIGTQSGTTDYIRLQSGNETSMYTIIGNGNFVTLRAEYANSGTTCYWVVEDESELIKVDYGSYDGDATPTAIAGVSFYTATGINANGQLNAAINNINPGDTFKWRAFGSAGGTVATKSILVISGNPVVHAQTGQTMFTLTTTNAASAGDWEAEIIMYVISDTSQTWSGTLHQSGATRHVDYSATTWDLSGVTPIGLYVVAPGSSDSMDPEWAEIRRWNR